MFLSLLLIGEGNFHCFNKLESVCIMKDGPKKPLNRFFLVFWNWTNGSLSVFNDLVKPLRAFLVWFIFVLNTATGFIFLGSSSWNWFVIIFEFHWWWDDIIFIFLNCIRLTVLRGIGTVFLTLNVAFSVNLSNLLLGVGFCFLFHRKKSEIPVLE